MQDYETISVFCIIMIDEKDVEFWENGLTCKIMKIFQTFVLLGNIDEKRGSL